MSSIPNSFFEEGSKLDELLKEFSPSKKSDSMVVKQRLKELIETFSVSEIILLDKDSSKIKLTSEELEELKTIISKLRTLYIILHTNKYNNFRIAFGELLDSKDINEQVKIIYTILDKAAYNEISSKIFKLHFIDGLDESDICKEINIIADIEYPMSKSDVVDIIKNIVNHAWGSVKGLKQKNNEKKVSEQPRLIVKENFYSIFKGFSKKEIFSAMHILTKEEIELIYKIYEYNLGCMPKKHNYSTEEYYVFERSIVPRLRNYLKSAIVQTSRAYQIKPIDKK